MIEKEQKRKAIIEIWCLLTAGPGGPGGPSFPFKPPVPYTKKYKYIFYYLYVYKNLVNNAQINCKYK